MSHPRDRWAEGAEDGASKSTSRRPVDDAPRTRPAAPEGGGGGAEPDPGRAPEPSAVPPVRRAGREVYGWRGTSPRRASGGHARPGRRHRLRRALIAFVLVALTATGGTYAWADTKLDRTVDLGAYGHRPPPDRGVNYLIVGSDSRDGLSGADVRQLHAGGGGGRRTDSMIVLHTDGHRATMVSLPRDSWITIPRHLSPSTGKRTAPEKDKLNAAFSYGGPELLIRTVEHNTGLRIDHYAEIGFAGFVSIVNAVGGVHMCLPHDVRDEKSGADLKRGCQNLRGDQALAFVRQRHQERSGDLGRTRNQQKFLSALAHKAVTPRTLLDPSELYPALGAGLDTLVVDRDMSLQDLVAMGRSLRSVTGGRGRQVNVPVSGVGIPTSKGNVIRWNARRARVLFAELRHGRPVTETGKARP